MTIHASKRVHHPIFDQETKVLLGLLPKLIAGQLGTVDRRLLFLSLLHSTTLLDWRVPATPSDERIAQLLTKVISVVDMVHQVPNAVNIFPRYVIDNTTTTMEDLRYYLDSLVATKNQLPMLARTNRRSAVLRNKEDVIARLMRGGKNKNRSKYAAMLAEWVAIAGNFPDSVYYPEAYPEVPSTTVAEHWKDVIKFCGSKKLNWDNVPMEDIDKIEDWLGEQADTGNFELGTVLSKGVFNLLNDAKDTKKALYGDDLNFNYVKLDTYTVEIDEAYEYYDDLGTILVGTRKVTKIVTSLPSTSTMMAGGHSKDQIELAKLAATAPTELPVRSKYLDNISYLRAKNAYQAMQRQLQVATPVVELAPITTEVDTTKDDTNDTTEV